MGRSRGTRSVEIVRARQATGAGSGMLSNKWLWLAVYLATAVGCGTALGAGRRGTRCSGAHAADGKCGAANHFGAAELLRRGGRGTCCSAAGCPPSARGPGHLRTAQASVPLTAGSYHRGVVPQASVPLTVGSYPRWSGVSSGSRVTGAAHAPPGTGGSGLAVRREGRDRVAGPIGQRRSPAVGGHSKGVGAGDAGKGLGVRAAGRRCAPHWAGQLLWALLSAPGPRPVPRTRSP
jgi:hypothetical protein